MTAPYPDLVGPHGLEPWTKGFVTLQLSLPKHQPVGRCFIRALDYLIAFNVKSKSFQCGQASGARGGY